MENRERMEQMMEEQYNKGIAVGMELMMEKLRMAADNGTPIEIDGHAWWLKSDIENLRDIFEDIHEMCRKSIKKETFTSYKTLVTKIVRKVNVSNRQNP